MTHLTAAAAIIVSLYASAAAADGSGLTWPEREVTVEAEIGTKQAEGSFGFTNAGGLKVSDTIVGGTCGVR